MNKKRKANPKPTQEAYKGLQGNVRGLVLPEIESWKNEYHDKEFIAEHVFPEFTCVCPKTGLPDFAELTIRYVPALACLELKSLKMYLVAYRDIGIFNEHVVNRVLEDLWKSTKPRAMHVIGLFSPRGGIQTKVFASRGRASLLKTNS